MCVCVYKYNMNMNSAHILYCNDTYRRQTRWTTTKSKPLYKGNFTEKQATEQDKVTSTGRINTKHPQVWKTSFLVMACFYADDMVLCCKNTYIEI